MAALSVPRGSIRRQAGAVAEAPPAASGGAAKELRLWTGAHGRLMAVVRRQSI